MGYTTDFKGKFELNKPLSTQQAKYLKMFAHTRRMKRNPAAITKLPAIERNQECLNLLTNLDLPLGPEGAYYCGPMANYGQDHDASVIDFNAPPATQPGLWCQWVPTSDRMFLKWDGSEKFNHYEEWIRYLIVSFLRPWGLTLNGEVKWQGEETRDRGLLIVKDNIVTTKSLE